MLNYKLTIQYKGTNYSGWQIQINADSVQQRLTDAIQIITKEKVNLIASGRTDAGVHALGQVANFRINKELDLRKFQYSLNSILPYDIAVIKTEPVHPDFHARFDAKKRSYIYLLSKMKSPFFNDFAHQLNWLDELHTSELNVLSKILIGEFDFSSFTKKSNDIENKKCSIFDIHWRTNKELTVFFIEANRFLHGMVRAIVGTLLFTYEKKMDKNFLLEILNEKKRESASMAVPGKGLFLYKVKY